jgi:type IV secretion system protein TrbE
MKHSRRATRYSSIPASPLRGLAGTPQSTQFLDYQVVNSNIEAERDHLRVGDHMVRILTMKEATTETRPLVLDRLLKIQANFCVATEWVPLTTAAARKEVTHE